MQSVLPEHGCLLVSPGNYWQNQRELFDSDADLLKTIQKHEPKGLHTSATLRGRDECDGKTVEADGVKSCGMMAIPHSNMCLFPSLSIMCFPNLKGPLWCTISLSLYVL